MRNIADNRNTKKYIQLKERVKRKKINSMDRKNKLKGRIIYLNERTRMAISMVAKNKTMDKQMEKLGFIVYVRWLLKTDQVSNIPDAYVKV